MKRSLFCVGLAVVLSFFSCQESKKKQSMSDEIKHLQVDSEILGTRKISVYLPSSYDGKKPHQVLYMMDGQMLFDATSTWNGQEWGVDEHMSALQGKIAPTIVVGVWNADEKRHSEYFPQAPFESLDQTKKDSLMVLKRGESPLFAEDVYSDEFLEFLVEELKPYIDLTFKTLPDASSTFISGSSMGGLIAMYAHCEYPQVFGGSASLSTHWPGIFTMDNNPVPAAFRQYLIEHIPNPENHRFYFDFGTETLDSLYEDSQLSVDSIFKTKGYTIANYQSQKFEGADHSEKAWNDRLSIPLSFLLAQ